MRSLRSVRLTVPLVLLAILAAVGSRTGPPVEAQGARGASPDLLALGLLVSARQGVNVGAPTGADSAGPGLLHFQALQGPKNPARNSMEMHPDGTVYVAVTPATSPLWYDTYEANHSDKWKNTRVRAALKDNRPFHRLKDLNVNPRNWLPAAQALPPGRGLAPRWYRIRPPAGKRPADWQAVLRGPKAQVNRLVRGPAPVLLTAPAACCFGSTWNPVDFTGPPEWQTLFPVNAGKRENGQRRLIPGKPLTAPGNRPVSWAELLELAQTGPNRARDIVKWRGRPSREDIRDRRIPWAPCSLEGVVTNSFLAGTDYGHSHREPGRGYWLGDRPPRFAYRSGWFPADGDLVSRNALCNDWCVFVLPDPEYRCLLAGRPGARGREAGNFDGEHQGNLENEIEQWLVPVGYRPGPGDRIYMTGRWIIDCGHDNFAAELHPYELVVSSHTETGRRAAAVGRVEAVANVVITGAWAGGTLEFDLWPAARPSATARLRFARDGGGIARELTVREELLPKGNPNHVRVRVTSTRPAAALLTKDHNDVYYTVTRRLAARYRLWWQAGG